MLQLFSVLDDSISQDGTGQVESSHIQNFLLPCVVIQPDPVVLQCCSVLGAACLRAVDILLIPVPFLSVHAV